MTGEHASAVKSGIDTRGLNTRDAQFMRDLDAFLGGKSIEMGISYIQGKTGRVTAIDFVGLAKPGLTSEQTHFLGVLDGLSGRGIRPGKGLSVGYTSDEVETMKENLRGMSMSRS